MKEIGITLVLLLFFSTCEKDSDNSLNVNIDLIELSDFIGKSYDEIYELKEDNFISESELEFSTNGGSYLIELYYNNIREIVSINGVCIPKNNSSITARQLKDFIEFNFSESSVGDVSVTNATGYYYRELNELYYYLSDNPESDTSYYSLSINKNKNTFTLKIHKGVLIFEIEPIELD